MAVVERFAFDLPAEVASARGAWRRREGLLVRVAGEDGRVGVGEASPLPGYSRESIEDCAAELTAGAPRSPAACFAWETALADLEAQRRGVGLAEVLGGDSGRVVAESALVADVGAARAALARGVTTFKVKISVAGAWAQEMAFLRELRAVLPESCALRLDGGGAIGRERLAELAAFRPEFVEEPVSGAALAAMVDAPVPLAADESLQDPALWPALAATCRVVVLKPTALGLARCLELGRDAAARGLKVVVTHTFDGPVARAAAGALARALPPESLAACALCLTGGGGGALSIAAAAAECGDRPALVAEGRTYSFAEVAALAAAAPEAAAVVADNRVATVAGILAAFERGTPALLVHPRLTEVERAQLLAEAAAHTPAPGTAAILFTSGTTGRPRGAQLSADAIVASAAASAVNLGWRDDDRWMACMPLAHVGGLSILTRCLLARACVVLEPRFDAASLPARLEAEHVTLLSLVPTMLAKLMDEHPAWTPPPRLRAVLLGGAGTPPRLLERARARGVPVLTTYGLTEACSQVVTGGRALHGAEVRIGADERIQVRGPMLMTGYLGEPPLAPGAWFDTGDLGELDADGVLRVHARRTDLIVTGGENVYPAEVEDALTGLPGVLAACVFGVPDETWGHIVAALVVGAPGPGLAAAIAARLAPHKRPRRIAYVDTLPVTPAGKPDRAAAARVPTAPLTY